MPIVAALPAIAAVAGTAASAKSLLSNGGPGAAQHGGADPVRIVGAEGAAKSYDRVENALAQQNAFTQALQNAGGIQNQQQVYGQLQGIANGAGPNPAQAMLNNTTGQNVAQTAALMGSQRGVSANPALIARQVGNAGANIQQQAAGQAAALQAQQSLNAINSAGNIANNQVANASQAGNAYTGAEQGTYGQLINQITAQNNTAAGLQGNVNTSNASMYGHNIDAAGNLIGNASGAIGTIAGLGGKSSPSAPEAPAWGGNSVDPNEANFVGPSPMAQGGEVKQSPVMIHLMGSGTKMAVGGNVGSRLQSGGKVPGKPAVGGAVNSYANDQVKALLSPGEIVIPRAITQGKDPVKGAAAFVAATMAKGGKSLPKKK